MVSDQSLKRKKKPEELILVKEFIDEGKNEKALQLMNDFEEMGEHTLYEISQKLF